MEAPSVENILEYLQRIRKTLFIGVITVLLAITVRAYLEDVKLDIKYLQVRNFHDHLESFLIFKSTYRIATLNCVLKLRKSH